MNDARTAVDLVDYRRRVAGIYARVRDGAVPIEERHARFFEERSELFRRHPASPIAPDRRHAFGGIGHHAYDASFRFEVELRPHPTAAPLDVDLGPDGVVRLIPIGTVALGPLGSLTVLWIGGYGGGLFLPFRDATNGDTTYGGGRYVLDTVKHADLGTVDGRLVIDLNFAYHPSCAWDPRWVCPLAPPANRLEARVEAGERLA